MSPDPAPPHAAPRPSKPRITPVDPATADAQTAELLAQVGGPAGGASNIFATFVRHPGLFRRWLPFGGKLLSGRLSARHRELLILRTGWNCQAEYEWGQHVVIGKASGLDDAEIERVKEGPDAAGWDPFEAILLRAALAAVYDDKQLIEVPMVVGHYHLVGFTLNSLGVQLEPGLAGFVR
jgi:alkylhydroperoxidase family enzyme